MLRVPFSFLLKLKSYYPYKFISPLQQTLKQNHCASHICYNVRNMLKLLAFNWLLKELLLRGLVILVIFLNQIIRSFLKFSFLISLFKLFPLQFPSHWKNYLFSIYRYHYGNTNLFFFWVFPQKGIIFFFSFAHLFNKIVKSKCKTPFSKFLKVYICCIFLI